MGRFVVRGTTNPKHMYCSTAAGILLGTPILELKSREEKKVPWIPALQHTMTSRPVESIRHNIIAHVFPRVLLAMKRGGELERLLYLTEDEI